MLKSKIIIKRIGDRKNNSDIETDRIEFEYGESKFVLTPDFDGKFRINKQHDDDDSVIINPGCKNEILVG